MAAVEEGGQYRAIRARIHFGVTHDNIHPSKRLDSQSESGLYARVARHVESDSEEVLRRGPFEGEFRRFTRGPDSDVTGGNHLLD